MGGFWKALDDPKFWAAFGAGLVKLASMLLPLLTLWLGWDAAHQQHFQVVAQQLADTVVELGKWLIGAVGLVQAAREFWLQPVNTRLVVEAPPVVTILKDRPPVS